MNPSTIALLGLYGGLVEYLERQKPAPH